MSVCGDYSLPVRFLSENSQLQRRDGLFHCWPIQQPDSPNSMSVLQTQHSQAVMLNSSHTCSQPLSIGSSSVLPIAAGYILT